MYIYIYTCKILKKEKTIGFTLSRPWYIRAEIFLTVSEQHF